MTLNLFNGTGNLLSFLRETRRLLMICPPTRLGNREKFGFFPAENKELETNFLVIFISCLESKPLKSDSGYYSL